MGRAIPTLLNGSTSMRQGSGSSSDAIRGSHQTQQSTHSQHASWSGTPTDSSYDYTYTTAPSTYTTSPSLSSEQSSNELNDFTCRTAGKVSQRLRRKGSRSGTASSYASSSDALHGTAPPSGKQDFTTGDADTKKVTCAASNAASTDPADGCGPTTSPSEPPESSTVELPFPIAVAATTPTVEAEGSNDTSAFAGSDSFLASLYNVQEEAEPTDGEVETDVPAPNALSMICTAPIISPPSPVEQQRRRAEGRLPYPSHLTFRLVPVAPPSPNAALATGVASAPHSSAVVGGVLAEDGRQFSVLGERKKKTTLTSCCGLCDNGDRERRHQKAEEDAAARRASYREKLKNHHVPLVRFTTIRDARGSVGPSSSVPIAEEAAGYRLLDTSDVDEEAQPRKLTKGLRQHGRPGSGLHLKTSYAYGRRAGGGPKGGGRSAFLEPGDPQLYWVSQLHERPAVHLERIGT